MMIEPAGDPVSPPRHEAKGSLKEKPRRGVDAKGRDPNILCIISLLPVPASWQIFPLHYFLLKKTNTLIKSSSYI
jgi:hypothetical protein